MECSIIIAVLDSHEMVRRQLQYMNTLIPPGVEVILVDDGSTPPLAYDGPVNYPLRILHTNDFRPWTQDKARNLGAAVSTGKHLLMNDIDHILTPDTLAAVAHFRGDMLTFNRRSAELDENGTVVNIGRELSSPPNIYAIRRDLYQELGGYETDGIIYGTDRQFRARYQKFVTAGKARPPEKGGEIYAIEDGRFFHHLPRKLLDGLLGKWQRFDLADWKGAADDKFLNRDRILALLWQRLHRYVPEYLVSSQRCRMLDVASGNGAAMEVFRYFGHQIHGLDYTPGLSDRDPSDWYFRPLIQSQGLACTVHDGASVPYPFADKSCDVLICWGAFSCFRPVTIWPRILDEFARLTTKCILLCDNVGPIYDEGKPLIEQWTHPHFELVERHGEVFKWCNRDRPSPLESHPVNAL